MTRRLERLEEGVRDLTEATTNIVNATAHLVKATENQNVTIDTLLNRVEMLERLVLTVPERPDVDEVNEVIAEVREEKLTAEEERELDENLNEMYGFVPPRAFKDADDEVLVWETRDVDAVTGGGPRASSVALDLLDAALALRNDPSSIMLEVSFGGEDFDGTCVVGG